MEELLTAEFSGELASECELSDRAQQYVQNHTEQATIKNIPTTPVSDEERL